MLSKILKSNKYKNRDINTEYHEEYQYINLINDVLLDGSDEIGRNGATKMVFGTIMEFDLNNNSIPILTTKRVAIKHVYGNYYGSLMVVLIMKYYKDSYYMNGNARDFLDSRGLYDNSEMI